jgi:hypothetical protein
MKKYFIPLAIGLFHQHLYAAEQTIFLNPISSVRNGSVEEVFANSAAEIVKFDAVTQRMYVVNGLTNSIDIFNAANPSNPTLITSISLSQYGNPNSVDVNPNPRANEIAVAVTAPTTGERGKVIFLNKSGDFLSSVEVGHLPDMLTYNSSGSQLLVANEGEPNDDYTIDPEGSVSIIKIAGRNRTHSEITFSHLNAEALPGVRITGPTGTTVAQDLEPEFISIAGNTAYVTCQENNAVVKIDIKRKKIMEILPLGSIDHASLGNAIDVSDRDVNGSSGGGGLIRIANWPVRGLLMPDGIDTYSAPTCEGSKIRSTYFVTANEGDGRVREGYSDEGRVSSLTLDPSAFPLGDTLKLNQHMGRLTVVTTEGKVEGQNQYQQLYSFGTRSFSIFDHKGNMVFDSGEMIETYIAANYPNYFNSNHEEGVSLDNRSDNKGPEPESIEIGEVNGRTYAFVGLERFSGILVCDITNPRDVTMSGFGLNRDLTVNYSEDNLANAASAGDLGPEGLCFVPANRSPNGKPLLIVANEISGTTTIYEVSNLSN